MSATRDALIDLLKDLFSTPGLSITAESSVPVELQATTLLLQSSRSATIPQIAELLLHVLLSISPFEHSLPVLHREHQQRFKAIWTVDHDLAFGKTIDEDNALTAMVGLNVLSAFRPNLQRLHDSGFRFVSDLVLSCLMSLSPEGSSRNLNIRGWVDAHGASVSILSELFHSIPTADWMRLDDQTEWAVNVWKCLQLLSSGASWWSMESTVHRENMLRLAKCVCELC